jgi:hypothetical protein
MQSSLKKKKTGRALSSAKSCNHEDLELWGSNHIDSMNMDKLDLTILLILIPDCQVKTFAENIVVVLVPPQQRGRT